MIKLNLVEKQKSEIHYVHSKFPDSQQQIIIDPNSLTLDKDVLIISRFNSWMDLEKISCAVASLRNLEATSISLYIPYFLGARSDVQFEAGSNNYLKDVICPVINSLNLDLVTVLDPHSTCLEMGIKNFQKETNHLFVYWALNQIKLKNNGNEKAVLISPDGGALKKIYKLVDFLNYSGQIITCSKSRGTDGKLSKTVIPEVPRGKDLVIIDDLADGGGTFINIAKEIEKQRARWSEEEKGNIYLIVTHGIFSRGFQELEKYFTGIFTTNSYADLIQDCESGTKGVKIDMWIGATDDQFYPEIPKNLVHQFKVI